MNRRSVLLLVLVVLLAFPLVGLAAPPDDPGKPVDSGPPDDPGPPDDHPGNKDPLAATPNLSFPIIATDIIQMFYLQTWVDSDGDGEVDGSEWVLDYDLDDDGVNEMTEPTPIEVTEVINVQYNGSYPGNDLVGEDDDAEHCAYTVDPVTGCAVDISGPDGVADGIIDDLDLSCEPMLTWLQSMQPWYDQPVTTTDADPNLIWNADYVDAANSWQADWVMETESVVTIDFIDWGNPLENINPIVGQRFPVEVALYEKVADWVDGVEGGADGYLADTSLTAYKMACLEYPGTKVELFGTSVLDTTGFTYESAFATVLTTKFTAEVYNPDGTITSINISPGIGPSGKMNFASGGGGWIPTMVGWHRIWLHVNDPLISFSGAIVNNDEHYIMTSGCMAQTLNPNKLELTGIIGDSTYIDVYVVRPSGNH